MSGKGAVVIVGGTSVFGIGVGKHYVEQGHKIYLTSRDEDRAKEAAKEVGGDSVGFALDLADPKSIAAALEGIEDVEYLVITSVLRDENSIKDYNIDGATTLITMKLIGFTEVIHQIVPRMRETGAIVLYGGLAKDRPYPGSITVTTVNGGVMTMINSLALQIAPIRINAIHPAIVGDSPYWAKKPAEVLEGHRKRTPLGRLVAIEDVVHATIFLLENKSATGVNLNLDGGWLIN